MNYALRHHNAAAPWLPSPAGETVERVHGHALFTASGESGAIDLGDVVMHQLELSLSRKPIIRAGRYGLLQRGERVTGAQSVAYTLSLQEATVSNLELLLCAVAGADAEQPAQAGTSAAFAGIVRGRTYILGYFDVRAVVVSVSGETFAEGRDYTVDAQGGTLHITAHGAIPQGATVVVTFDAGPVRSATLTALHGSAPLSRTGTLRIVEHDGLHDAYTGGTFARVISFACVISRDEESERSGDDAASFSLRAVPTGPLSILRRTIAEPRLVRGGVTLTIGSRFRHLGRMRQEQSSRFIIR